MTLTVCDVKKKKNTTSPCVLIPFFCAFCRSNEHLSLMVFHVLFFREHNRLARKLYTLNPHWNDERTYQVV